MKFVRGVYQTFDSFFLYEKEGKIICALFAMDHDAFCGDPYGYQFSFEISRSEMIPEKSKKKRCIDFNEHFN